MKKRLLALIPVMLVVFLCTSNVFAAQTNDIIGRYFKSDVLSSTTGYTDIRYQIYLTIFYPTHGNTGGMNQTTLAQYEYQQNVLGYFVIQNNNDYDVRYSGTYNKIIRMNVMPVYESLDTGTETDYYWNLTDVQYLGGQLLPTSLLSNNVGTIQFEHQNLDYDGSDAAITIPAHGSICCYFMMTWTTLIPQSTFQHYVQFNDNTVYLRDDSRTPNFGDYHENYVSYVPDIYETLVNLYTVNQNQLSALQQILASYTQNVPQSTTVTNDSSSLQTTSDNVHTQESSYYTQTNTYLSNTGLSNYSFNSNIVGGLGKVKDHFTYVWNKMGSYTDVYIFSMTIGIALMIIRHVRPIRRKKEE